MDSCACSAASGMLAVAFRSTCPCKSAHQKDVGIESVDDTVAMA